MIKQTTRQIKTSRPKKEPVLRFVALGGLEEIGRNMMFFEYRDEIVVIDMGLQFPEEETPGIDYIIPNTAYLEAKRQNVKAIIITHAHYDHIGAIPYLLGRLGNPKIYTTRLTKEIILKRQGEFPKSVKPSIEPIEFGKVTSLSKYFCAEFFSVTHNIPDTIGLILHTPMGKIVHPGEFKFDHDKEGKPKDAELEKFEKIGNKGIHLLMLDSTNAEEPGYSLSERVVERTLEEIFRKSSGRIIVGTFASLLDRIAEIIKIAQKLNRKVAISGYSMYSNIQIARRLGYIKASPESIIPVEEISKYHDNKLLILCTGAQGEPNASLMKIINGEHRYLQIKQGDTVVFSSSIVPGNERAVQNLKDNLARQGAKIFHSKIVDIHSSGHAPQEELKLVLKMVKPKFFLPIHGYYFMRWRGAELAQEVGIPKENTILTDNGQVIEISKNTVKVTKENVPAFYVMIDGLGVGDVGEVVLRDRKTLAQEGMVVIIATLKRESGKLLKNPDIISRGFIYLRENQELVEEIRSRVKGITLRIPKLQPIDADYLKSLIRDQIGQFLYNKTKRRPMILPVVIEV